MNRCGKCGEEVVSTNGQCSCGGWAESASSTCQGTGEVNQDKLMDVLVEKFCTNDCIYYESCDGRRGIGNGELCPNLTQAYSQIIDWVDNLFDEVDPPRADIRDTRQPILDIATFKKIFKQKIAEARSK